MAEFNDIYKEGRPLKAEAVFVPKQYFLATGPSGESVACISVCRSSASAPRLRACEIQRSRDLIAEANVIMEEVPNIDRLEKI